MSHFYLEVSASAIYSVTSPTLEVLVDGLVVSSTTIGGSLGTYGFALEYTGSFPSTLSLRFNDGSGEVGRTINIDTVRINGTAVNPAYLGALALANGQSSAVNTTQTDHLYGRVTPVVADSGTPTQTGTGGDDSIRGSSDPEIIDAGNGNDRVNGQDTDDAIYGGDGDDMLFGNGGSDILVGGAGADTIMGNDGDDLLHGGDDDDAITGGNGNDLLNGGAGDDSLIGGNGNDIIFGEDGADRITSGLADDFVYGDSGDDIISAGAGNDTVYGGLDNDQITGGAGNDTLYGEGGNDQILGGVGDDTLYGNNGADTLNGNDGADTIYGGDGDDIINGDADNDTIDGGAENDTMTGGLGTDTVTYATAASAVTVNLATATAQNTIGAGTDTISGFENLIGSAFNDKLTGDTGNNTITAGDGDDVVIGGAGNDTLTGGNGTDTINYSTAGSAVTFNLATLTAQATGGAGTDTVSGFEDVVGSDYNDNLTGDAGNNNISGGAGSDTLTGGAGNDTLHAVLATTTLITTNFNATLESFVYADNSFGGTGGAYVNGTRSTTDGVNGNGSLEIVFDGTNATVSGTMSGAFSRTFTATTDADDTVLTFDYKVIRTGTYETNEDSFVYIDLDGVKYGLNGNDHIIRYESDGNDPTYNSGWVHIELNLGTIAAGSHTLTVGGMVEGKDAANEDTTIRFDNIVMQTDVTNDDTAANVLYGGANNDTLYGSAGTDTLNGDAGNDTIYSGSTANINSAAVLAAYSGVTYNATTNSFYKYVNTSLTWEAAQSAAAANLIFGVAGHLAQSNSATENAYLDSIDGGNSTWMGGTDGAVNGEWRWVGGTNDGVQFWQGLAGGSAVGGAYTNWAAGEPNDWNGYESRLMMYNGGQWNDQLEASTARYIIEWEASQILVAGNTTTLAGGDGLDTLYGSAGSDTFLFDSNAYNDIDVINGFDMSGGDQLDLADLLSGYDPATESITDFVMISDGTQADSYIANIVNRDALLHYRLGETSGTTATDSMSVLNGTYVNTPTLNAADFNGSLANNAVDFNGTNEYVRVSDNSAFDLNAATFMGWFRSDTSSATKQTVMSKDGTTGGQFNIGVTTNDGDIVGMLQNGGGAAINFDINQSVALNTWYHLAITLSTTSGVQIYLNGNSIYTNAGFTTALGSNYDFIIGASNTAGNTTMAEYFNGRVDEVSVFNYKMSGTTITNIYNAGVAAVDGTFADGVYVATSGNGVFNNAARIADFTGTTTVTNVLDMLSADNIITT